MTRMYQIHKASPKALAECPKGFDEAPDAFRPLQDAGKSTKYPFRRLAVGTCFVVPFSELPLKSGIQNMRNQVSNANRVMKPVKFLCIVHDTESLVEVARIL